MLNLECYHCEIILINLSASQAVAVSKIHLIKGLKPYVIGYHLFSAINGGANDIVKLDSIAPSFMTGKELYTDFGL